MRLLTAPALAKKTKQIRGYCQTGFKSGKIWNFRAADFKTYHL
jgi:hypothetical protein